MEVNLNDNVRVKLNDAGREIHKIRHDELYDYIESRGVPSPTYERLKYRPPKEDSDGWSEWQLWDLMSLYGPHITLGAALPFETTIEIAKPPYPE